MSETKIGEFTTSHPVVMVFPALITPSNFKGKGDPKYAAKFLFSADHPDLPDLKKIVVAVARAKWPGADLKSLEFPIANGDTLADKAKTLGKYENDFFRGNAVVRSSSKFEPKLSAIVRGKLQEFSGPTRAANSDRFFSGAEVLVGLNFYAYDISSDNRGVGAYLDAVLATGKGTRISAGGQSAAERFAGYVGRVSEYEPGYSRASQDDDEIPF